MPLPAIRLQRALPYLVAFAAVAAPVTAGDTHPNLQRGLEVASSLQTGDVDHVNLFNGALNLAIPIGQGFPVNGGLSYGLTLVHNSNVWDFRERVDPDGTSRTSAVPNPRNNAGLGWMLSFGHVGLDAESGLWTYTAADGSEHAFLDTLHGGETPTSGQRFTRDGSYLRMNDLPGGAHQVEFPHGEARELGPDGELRKIYDRFGNLVSLTPLDGGLTWQIGDTHGREQRVAFAADAVLGKRVTSVALTAFNGTTATYTFGYTEMTVDRPCPDSDPDTLPLTVNMLTSVTLPDGSSYAMPSYHLDQTAGCRTPGAIRSLTLPTLGKIAWTYQPYSFPAQPPGKVWRTVSNGVATRTLTDAAGAVLGTWRFTTALDPPPSIRQLVNTVTTPLGHKVDNYFSVALEELNGWTVSEYGLPLTRNVADATGNRFLSTRTYAAGSSTPLRETYVRYERDAGATAADPAEAARSNQRLASTRTVYLDDPVAGSPQGGKRFADTDSSDFDGLGHYRTAETGGNFDAGNVRASHTRYNPGRGTYPGSFSMLGPAGPWLLETFDMQEVTEGGQTARRTFAVEADTSWVSRLRTHRLGTGSESSQDVVVERLRDGAGNLTSERHYGGDTQPAIALGPLAGLTLPPTPQYRLDHTSQYGVEATATYVDAAGAALSFKSLDRTIDLGTGLTISSRDTSGIGTAYEYDALGRLRFAKPEPGHDGWTEYLYTPASSSSALAQVNVYRRPNGGGTPLAEGLIKVDAFGRPWQEQRKMPDGSWSTRETLYDGMGWKASVSELGSPTKTTRYTYDPFGRPVKVTPPDGVGHEVTFAYLGVRSVGRAVQVRDALEDEHQATTSEVYDRQGRLHQVEEEAEGSYPTFTNTTTTYSYDVGNRVVHVEQDSSAGTQHRGFTYDQRGFLLSEQHPEKGASGNGFVFYADYDSRGHAGRKYECSAPACNAPEAKADLSFGYDRAERLITVSQAGVGPLKSFTYGSSNAAGARTNGRLEVATRYNYLSAPINLTRRVDETYAYGGRQGRASRRITQSGIVGSPPDRTFDQTWSYDALGNVTGLGYPNCTFAGCPSVPRTLSLAYTQGRLTSVAEFATSITYHPDGTVHQVTHGNAVVDTQAVDPDGMARPAALSTRRAGSASDQWSSGAYAYDGAGNVARMGNSYFLYDRAGRLIDAHVDDGPTGGGGTLRRQTYTYDPFGNLTNIGGDRRAPGRATPTSAATNRLTAASYDVAGNMVGHDGATYEFDGLGMMTRRLEGPEDRRYVYTAGDQRLIELQPGAAGEWALRDLDGKVLRELQGQSGWSPREYFYRDGQLLASSFAGEGVRHFSLDHLGTPRLVTSGGGYSRGVWTGGAATCKPAVADYDGDGGTDLSLKCGPAWHFYRDDGSHLKSMWTGGPDSDVPVPADYDGDGDADPVVYNGGGWHFYDYLTGAYRGVWTGGAEGCVPAPADYDGDGNADLSLKCGPAWHFYKDNGSNLKSVWLGATDSQLPVPGDYDGDGDVELAISNGATWELYDYKTGAHIRGVWTGANGVPRAMDYDGDGTADFTVYAGGGWLAYRDDGSPEQGLWTASGAAPVPGNFTGERTQEPALYAGGAWSIYSFAGMPVSRHVYFPFGEEISSPTQDAEQMKLGGHERDLGNPGDVTDDLDSMHARYFHPLLGRFLSVDTGGGIPGHPQSWNRYAYVLGLRARTPLP